MLVQESPWSMFMEGSQLTGSLKSALMATPAPGYFFFLFLFPPFHIKYLFCSAISVLDVNILLFGMVYLDFDLFCGISITELEKLYHITLNGSEEEKSSAAKILCGASLTYGWNIQVIHLC